MGTVIHTLNSCGLKTHEHVPACVKQEGLGVQLDGERLEARVIRKRVHRLRIVIDWALKRGRLRGQELEKLLGHCTFVGLLRRPCFSVFSSCYKFARATYAHTTRLWRSVSAELRAFRGLLPLMYSEWGLPWGGVGIATDASTTGWGACACDLDPCFSAPVGRVRERSRFKKNSCGARTSSLAPASRVLDPFEDLETVGPVGASGALDDTWTVDESFPEVPQLLTASENWRVIGKGRFFIPEAAHLLEARAIVRGLECAHAEHGVRDCRHLFLVGSMYDRLAFERSRAQSYPLLAHIRRFAAVCFVLNVQAYFRWIPSEWNPADAPSREATSHPLRPPATAEGLYDEGSRQSSSSSDEAPTEAGRDTGGETAYTQQAASSQDYKLIHPGLIARRPWARPRDDQGFDHSRVGSPPSGGTQ